MRRSSFLKPVIISGMFIVLSTVVASCAKVYTSPDAKHLTSNHRIVAIAPPTVAISPSRRMDAETLRQLQYSESINLQRELSGWLLRRKTQGKFHPDVLDVETTLAMLTDAGHFERALTPAQMCEILGVNAVITSNFAMAQPLTVIESVVLDIFSGGTNTAKEVRVSMSIHDGFNKKMVWNYDHLYTGGEMQSTAQLTNSIMRNATRKMPYR